MFLIIAAQVPGISFADEPENGKDAIPLEEARDLKIPDPVYQVIDPDQFQALIDDFIKEYRIRPKEISIGFYYSGSGEFAYYNDNAWYYSASLFKVPMVMSLVDRIYEGEMSWDMPLGGLTFHERADKALIDSHNPSAYQILGKYWSTEVGARRDWTVLSDMDPESFSRNYYNCSWFHAPFITRTMVNLLNNRDYYSEIIEDLKLAQPGDYFRRGLEDTYEIAQKYGSWEEFKHTSGIVFTEHPIVITIMTRNTPNENYLAGQLAKLLVNYTEQQLDPTLQKLLSENKE